MEAYGIKKIIICYFLCRGAWVISSISLFKNCYAFLLKNIFTVEKLYNKPSSRDNYANIFF